MPPIVFLCIHVHANIFEVRIRLISCGDNGSIVQLSSSKRFLDYREPDWTVGDSSSSDPCRYTAVILLSNFCRNPNYRKTRCGLGEFLVDADRVFSTWKTDSSDLFGGFH